MKFSINLIFSIDTLVQQAQTLSEDKAASVSQLFPSPDIWLRNLEGLLALPPDPSVSLTNPLGGAVFLVQSPMKMDATRVSRPSRDGSGYSVPFRMAVYTLRVLLGGNVFEKVPLDRQIDIMYSLTLTVQLAIDQLDLQEDNKLWASLPNSSIDGEVREFISSSESFLADHLTDIQGWDEALGKLPPRNKPSFFVPGLINKLLVSSKDLSSNSFHSARSLSNIMRRLSILHGPPQVSEAEKWIKDSKILSEASESPFPAVAVLCGLKLRTPGIEYHVNRLVSELPGIGNAGPKTLSKLVLINAALEANGTHEEHDVFSIAQNRVVFAVKEIVSWLNEVEDLNNYVAAEAARTLQGLFPYMQDTYGAYWENALVFCTELWSQEFGNQRFQRKLPVIHETLVLIDLLKDMDYCPPNREHERNDDLHDALEESGEAISHGLLHLLDIPRERQTKAINIVDTLVCTKAAKIPLRDIPDISDIYSHVGSENQKVASAAYSILHRAIPKAQEQISIDVLLEKRGKR